MKKVGLLTLEYPPTYGGVGRYYQKLVRESNGAIDVYDVEQLLAKPWHQLFNPVRRWIKRMQIDHVLVGHVLPLGTVMWLIHKVTGVQYSVFIHGMDIAVPQRYPRKKWLLRNILRNASHIFTVSEYTKEQIIEFDHKVTASINIISPGPFITPQTVEYSRESAPPIEQAYIVSIGRIVERKGFDYTVRALHELGAAAHDLQYVILGDGPYKQTLQSIIDELDMTDRVRILSGVSDSEVSLWLAHALAFCMPSRIVNREDFEGFGIVVLEANTFGKIAIGGNTAGMRDAIINNKTGILVDPDSVPAIAQAIKTVYEHPHHVASMEAQAQQWVSIEHTWAKKYQTLAKILNITS